MRSILLPAAGAVLTAVFQLGANDVLRNPEVTAEEAARAPGGPQRSRPLVALTFPWRLCGAHGACERHVLTESGIPDSQHAAVAAAVQKGWQSVQRKFMISASAKVIDGVHPVTFSGVLKQDVSAIAAPLEQTLSAGTGRQTAIFIASLFENEMLKVFSQVYQVNYYDRRGYDLDGLGSWAHQPCVMAQCQADGLMCQDIPPDSLGETIFSGLELRLAPGRAPVTAPSPFRYSLDYKW